MASNPAASKPATTTTTTTTAAPVTATTDNNATATAPVDDNKQQSGTVKQSHHQKKYDRQMRLWGAHGQQLLEEGKICVLGSGPAATETLKNCVLPAVGIFTLIDDVDVTITDLGNNFFVTQDDLGKKRAEVVTKWLLEMNPDVKGSALNQNYINIINNNIDYFKQFNIVIATQLYGNNHIKLSEYLYSNNIPYMNININGFMSRIRVQYNELNIIESHPTNDRTDLFIYPEQLKIFPELNTFCNSYDIDTKEVEKHAHLPCVAILAQFTKRYLAKNNNTLPANFKEQTEFKDQISVMGHGENYLDAVHWASQCYLKPRIDREVKEVLSDPKGDTLTATSSDFWILVRGLRDFMSAEGGGFLPCSTNIPDLTMDSKSYVKLKSIYKARTERDIGLIKKYVQKRLTELNKDVNCIPEAIIRRFALNVRHLKVQRTKSVKEEYSNPDITQYDELYMDMSMFDEKTDDEKPFQPLMINWYWAFRSLDIFYDENNRMPGNIKTNIDADVEKLIVIQTKLYADNKLQDKDIVKECLQEMTRYGASELHNIGAFVGGIGAQAIMKILLKQFYPYNHTYVFNGVHCEGAVISI